MSNKGEVEERRDDKERTGNGKYLYTESKEEKTRYKKKRKTKQD